MRWCAYVKDCLINGTNAFWRKNKWNITYLNNTVAVSGTRKTCKRDCSLFYAVIQIQHLVLSAAVTLTGKCTCLSVQTENIKWSILSSVTVKIQTSHPQFSNLFTVTSMSTCFLHIRLSKLQQKYIINK